MEWMTVIISLELTDGVVNTYLRRNKFFNASFGTKITKKNFKISELDHSATVGVPVFKYFTKCYLS